MNKIYSFKPNEIENIVNRFGKDFYEKVLMDLGAYAAKWNLTSFEFIPSYSANLVFKCCSESFGKAVLKIGNPFFREVITELNTLKEYNGTRFCKIHDFDIENGAILEECILPGSTLRNEDSLDKRLTVFSSLYKGLHIAPVNPEIYPTYIQWVCRITEYMSTRKDCEELYLHMKSAKDICLLVSNLYSRKVLLHGDFHHDNILLGNDGEYKIIDPKGVIGDPVFDVPRFILNEINGEMDQELFMKINHIIIFLEKRLGISSYVLRQCLYIETAMSVCWCVESGSTPEEYEGLIKTVTFAERILNEGKDK